MTHLGLTIITSRSNLDLLVDGSAGMSRKTSVSKRSNAINNSEHFTEFGTVLILSEKVAIFLYYFRFTFIIPFAFQEKEGPHGPTWPPASESRAKGCFIKRDLRQPRTFLHK